MWWGNQGILGVGNRHDNTLFLIVRSTSKIRNTASASYSSRAGALLPIYLLPGDGVVQKISEAKLNVTHSISGKLENKRLEYGFKRQFHPLSQRWRKMLFYLSQISY